jgi:hypothetical protein
MQLTVMKIGWLYIAVVGLVLGSAAQQVNEPCVSPSQAAFPLKGRVLSREETLRSGKVWLKQDNAPWACSEIDLISAHYTFYPQKGKYELVMCAEGLGVAVPGEFEGRTTELPDLRLMPLASEAFQSQITSPIGKKFQIDIITAVPQFCQPPTMFTQKVTSNSGSYVIGPIPILTNGYIGIEIRTKDRVYSSSDPIRVMPGKLKLWLLETEHGGRVVPAAEGSQAQRTVSAFWGIGEAVVRGFTGTSLGTTPAFREGNCTGSVADYKGYLIRRSVVASPLSYLRSVSDRLNFANHVLPEGARAGTRFQPGEVLSRTLLSQFFRLPEISGSAFALDAQMQSSESEYALSLRQEMNGQIAFAAMERMLTNCSSGQVDLRYQMFAFHGSSEVTFESRTRGFTRLAPSAAVIDALNITHPQPMVGYDSSRGFFGGTRLLVTLPKNRFVQSLTLDNYMAQTGFSRAATAIGGSRAGSGRMEWVSEYGYSETPLGVTLLRSSHLWGAGFFTTGELRGSGIVLRAGTAVEAGHRQTGLTADAAPSDRHLSSKLIFGVSRVTAHSATRLSYGREFGFPKVADTFTRDVADAATTITSGHVLLEASGGYGVSHVRGVLPAGERYYGGAIGQTNFLDAESWHIVGVPSIRSFPENTFRQVGTTLGGTAFWSFNLTAGVPIWQIPLVPRALTENPEFIQRLQSQLRTIHSAVQIDLVSHSPAFRDREADLAIASSELVRTLRPLQQDLDLKPIIAVLESSVSEHSYAEILGLYEFKLGKLSSSLEQELKKEGNPSRMATLTAARDATEKYSLLLSKLLMSLDMKAADKLAELDVSRTKRLLTQVFYQERQMAITPIVLFDTAQLRVHGASETRYGVGGGLRMRVGSLDFQAAYAHNVERRPSEPKGAVLFRMTLSDILR